MAVINKRKEAEVLNIDNSRRVGHLNIALTNSLHTPLSKQHLDSKMFLGLNRLLNGTVFNLQDETCFKKVLRDTDDVWLLSGGAYYGRTYMLDKVVDQYEELSKVIGIPAKVLKDYAENTSSHYRRFFIWKDEAKTKKRWIEAPDETLKQIQELILKRILYKVPPTKFSHGFVCGRSIVTNARVHTGKKFVLKLDLKNFFPSITREMLQGAMAPYINPDNAKFILPAIELCLLNGRLPQGAPTSPAASNIVGRKIDLLMYGIALKSNYSYSRYADDLVFSSNRSTLYEIIPLIKACINKMGLAVNEKKVKILKRHQRQTVTGLVVNAEGKTSVSRRKRMQLRAYIHHILVGRRSIESVNFPKLKGHITFIAMANPEQGRWFLDKLKEIEAMRE